ncbi:MAG: N-acetylmuramoyl-L-alanine amidase, partial [Eubacteriales bacterium]|nr:N-acetylmuramoyl-L-alanine amidase [Eubacteriales bacterium]
MRRIKNSRIYISLASVLCACLLTAGCGGSHVGSAPGGQSGAGGTFDEVQVVHVEPVDSDSGQGATWKEAQTASTSLQAETETSGVSSTESAPAVQDAPGSTDTEEDGVFSAEGKDLVIVLDPGHSSEVPGTEEPIGPGSTEMKEGDTEGAYGSASGLHEYELTMRVSQKLRAELEKRGYTVRLTHLDTVRPISCVERAEVANNNGADAFIRIHANSADDTTANGAMTICITQDNPYHPELYSASYRLSEIMLDTYCEQTGARREKVWETDTMTGNNWAEVPATLIEMGYMSNPDEDLMMAMDSYQKKIVNAIADGLDRWFGEMPEDELAMHPTLTGQKRASDENELPDEAPVAVPAAGDGGTGAAAVPVPAGGTGAGTGSDQQDEEDDIPLTVREETEGEEVVTGNVDSADPDSAEVEESADGSEAGNDEAISGTRSNT